MRKMPYLKASVGPGASSHSGPEISPAEVRSLCVDNTRAPGTPNGDSAQNKRSIRLQKRNLSPTLRRKREFVPEESKDANYWNKREKNNEAAKKSRERRRLLDMELETRVIALMGENERLKAELLTLKYQLGLTGVPRQSQTLCRGVLANLLPDLRSLKSAPALDSSSHVAPPFGLGYRERVESAFAASQLSPGPYREDALCLAGVFRQPSFRDGTIYSKEKLHCVKCNVESFGSSHLSKPQAHQLLVRGLESGSAIAFKDFQMSGTQRNFPHKLRFKTNEDCLQQKQNCLSVSSSKGRFVEIYVDPHKTHFAAFSDEAHSNSNVDRRLQRRLLFPWGLSNDAQPPGETG
ncbi:uncharacterized protein LOC144688848 [Cetorhinus maximus]